MLYKQSRSLFIFLMLLFITTIVYAVNYDIFDIGSYFLLSYIVIGWMTAYGIDFLIRWTKGTQTWLRVIIIVILVALPVIQIFFNLDRVDEKENKLPQEFVENTFSNLESNAVVLASQWDYFISPTLYYQFIQSERRDVTIIDKSLLQNRSWYFMQLEHQAPWLMNRVRPSMNLFLAQLDKFEHDVPFNFNVIQAQWQNLLSEIVEKSLPDHAVYIDGRIEQEFAPAYYRTPAGLFLRFTKTEDTVNYRTAIAPFSAWNSKQPVAKNFEEYYVTMLLREADWLLRKRRAMEAKAALIEVLRIEPGNYSAIWLMKRTEEMR
jgi:hypothetical protein